MDDIEIILYIEYMMLLIYQYMQKNNADVCYSVSNVRYQKQYNVCSMEHVALRRNVNALKLSLRRLILFSSCHRSCHRSNSKKYCTTMATKLLPVRGVKPPISKARMYKLCQSVPARVDCSRSVGCTLVRIASWITATLMCTLNIIFFCILLLLY